MAVFFEWSSDKAEINDAKHGVSFEEAVSCFTDPLSTTIHDPRHSVGERRYVLLGLSSRQRLLVVAHTEEETSNAVIVRLISARPASCAEVKQYEEGR